MKKISCLLMLMLVSFVLVGKVSAKKITINYLPSEEQYKNKYTYRVSMQSNSKKPVWVELKLKKSSQTLEGVPMYTITSDIGFDVAKSVIVQAYKGDTWVGQVGLSTAHATRLSDIDNKIITSNGKIKSNSENEFRNEVYNEEFGFKSVSGLAFVACGKGVTIKKCSAGGTGTGAYDIPYMIPRLTAFAVNALKIATPIILIFIGMITMIKAVTSSAEDEIKKAQSALVKKMLIAIMIFGVISITQFVIDLVSDSYSTAEANSATDCLNCFVNNDCPLLYYRDGKDQQKCVSLNSKK